MGIRSDGEEVPSIPYFHIRGDNGEILPHSEGCSRKGSARDTSEAIKRSISAAEVVDEI